MAPHIIRFLDFPCREKKLYMLCPGVAVREAIKVPWTTHKQVVICPSLQGMCFTTNRLEHINIRWDCSESVTYNKLTDVIKFVAWTSPIDINGTGHGTVYLYCLETQWSLDKCHYFVPLPDAQHLWGWPGHLASAWWSIFEWQFFWDKHHHSYHFISTLFEKLPATTAVQYM